MKRIGFLGCGKIGTALLETAYQIENVSVAFVQDLIYPEGKNDFPVIRHADEKLYAQCDLIIESTTADVLKENIDLILMHSNLMTFSLTAFSDQEFEDQVKRLSGKYKRQIYIPHGAILGIDGIYDGNRVWDSVSIETIKNPKSLGCENTERTVLFEGKTRDACKLYPRNVNVHAAVALAGIGFDRTVSRIIADPDVNTNSHVIMLEGGGVSMKLNVSSFAAGGVTGRYTPYSACGSFRRILDCAEGTKFV